MADLFRLSASEAAARIREGKLTSEALVHSCLERIHHGNHRSSWVHLNDDFAWRRRGSATGARAAVRFTAFHSLPRTLWIRRTCRRVRISHLQRQPSHGGRLVEFVDERLEALFCVALVGGVIERGPVGLTGWVRARVRAALRAGCAGGEPRNAGGLRRASLLDRLDQSGSAIGDDQQRRAEPRAIRSRPSAGQSSCDSRIPSITESNTRSPCSLKPQGSSPSLGPLGRTAKKTASRSNAASATS